MTKLMSIMESSGTSDRSCGDGSIMRPRSALSPNCRVDVQCCAMDRHSPDVTSVMGMGSVIGNSSLQTPEPVAGTSVRP